EAGRVARSGFQRDAGQPNPAGADPRSRVGMTGGAVARWQAQAWVGHQRSSLAVMESPTRRGRALAWGAIAAIGTGGAWAVLSAVLGLHLGLLVVAAFGGWLIGLAVRPVRGRAQRWAILLAVAAAVVGSVGDFVLSQLLLPQASTPLAERLS